MIKLDLIIFVFFFFTSSSAYREFCWKDFYERVGHEPLCPANTKLKKGHCYVVCPSYSIERGAFCSLETVIREPYSRGKHIVYDPYSELVLQECESKYGKGNCEVCNDFLYPKCKTGFSKKDCKKCNQTSLNCEKIGLDFSNIDPNYCLTKIFPLLCNATEEKVAGLCYPKCKPGYVGVGSVCWREPPNGWFDCGVAVCKFEEGCKIHFSAFTRSGYTYAIGYFAYKIATIGDIIELMTAPSEKLAEIKEMYSSIKNIYEKYEEKILSLKTDITDPVKAKNAIVKIGSLLDGPINDEDQWESLLGNAGLLASVVNPSKVPNFYGIYRC